MKKIYPILILIAISAVITIGFIFLVSKNNANPKQTNKITVITTIYPLKEFIQAVGGDLVEVENITPAGAEPHEFEPSPKDIAKILSADLFIYNGAGLDLWVERLKNDLEKNNIRYLDISFFVELKNMASENSGNLLVKDPHFWLDPTIAQTEVKMIREVLLEIDPPNAMIYAQNTDNYLAKLAELDNNFTSKLSNCTLHKAITSHTAFNYLGTRYGIEFLSIAGISPELEPSPSRIAELTDLAKKEGIKYIFFETSVNPRLAQTIANEAGLETLEINPLDSPSKNQIKAGATYLSEMQKNLENLHKALLCQ